MVGFLFFWGRLLLSIAHLDCKEGGFQRPTNDGTTKNVCAAFSSASLSILYLSLNAPKLTPPISLPTSPSPKTARTRRYGKKEGKSIIFTFTPLLRAVLLGAENLQPGLNGGESLLDTATRRPVRRSKHELSRAFPERGEVPGFVEGGANVFLVVLQTGAEAGGAECGPDCGRRERRGISMESLLRGKGRGWKEYRCIGRCRSNARPNRGSS